MPRESNHHSKFASREAWRAAYDITEAQASVLAALMSAQLLGYDGATAKALRSLGLTATGAHSVYTLQSVGLTEIVGYLDGTREAVYRATTRAFKRLGVPLPRPIPPVVQTAVGRAEMIAERTRRRENERQRRVRERQRVSA